MLKKELLMVLSPSSVDALTLTASYSTTAYSEAVDQVDFDASWSGGVAPYTLIVDGITKYTGTATSYSDWWLETEAPGLPESATVTDSQNNTATYVFPTPEDEGGE